MLLPPPLTPPPPTAGQQENTEASKLATEATNTFPDWNVDVQPGTNMLILKKKFQDEEIEVEINACQPQALDAMEEGEESEDEDRAAAKEVISVTVHVRKPEESNMLVISAGVTLEQYPTFELVNVQVAPASCTDAQLVEGGYYEGPEFHELDPSLQGAWETWLYDRGFDESFTEAVADLADMKESSEYLHWLRAAHKFVGGPAVPQVEFRE